MMKKDIDSLIDSFIKSFGDGSNSFEFRNQTDFVQQQNKIDDREQINVMNKDNENLLEKDENLSLNAQDETTGDEYVLELKRTQTAPDRKDVNITFSCVNDSSKYVNSTLEGLCEGRYASYSDKSLRTIANALCNDYEYIFSYADASLAKYAEVLDAERAIKVAQLAKDSDGMISYSDYKKISAKLSTSGVIEFNERLASSNIQVYFPTNQIKTSGLN